METAAISDLGHSARYIQLQNHFFKLSEKLHTHRHINEETYRSVFTFVEYEFFYNFLFEKPKKFDISDFFG